MKSNKSNECETVPFWESENRTSWGHALIKSVTVGLVDGCPPERLIVSSQLFFACFRARRWRDRRTTLPRLPQCPRSQCHGRASAISWLLNTTPAEVRGQRSVRESQDCRLQGAGSTNELDYFRSVGLTVRCGGDPMHTHALLYCT